MDMQQSNNMFKKNQPPVMVLVLSVVVAVVVGSVAVCVGASTNLKDLALSFRFVTAHSVLQCEHHPLL